MRLFLAQLRLEDWLKMLFAWNVEDPFPNLGFDFSKSALRDSMARVSVSFLSCLSIFVAKRSKRRTPISIHSISIRYRM